MDWRSWSAADRTAVAYLWLKRQNSGNHEALRELYELVGDTEAIAALDRQAMSQPDKVEVQDVRPRRG